ncbi:MAG TPA: transposase [Candidatus Angelobacter sp.]|nr:transposase [Candidatus Angelobacter sp.]
MLAFKSVKQGYQPTPEIRRLLEIFRRMVNDCVEIGLSCNVTALKRLSLLSWPLRREYECPSYYKLCAVSRAAGILTARKKSLRRGVHTKNPYSIRPQITAYQGFRIENGGLRVPVGKGRFEYVPLTRHSISTLSDPAVRVRSFTLTATSLSLGVSKEAPNVEFTQTIGVDRNLRNLTVGNEDRIVQYNLSETVRIAKTSSRIVGSFKRNDSRIRGKIASKHGRRRRNRTKQLLHIATKQIVAEAAKQRQAIVLENIIGIRSLYHKGNGQGAKCRGRMNGWSFSEAQRQLEYKARWVGLPVIRLSRKETMGTSVTCPQCGERLQEDRRIRRKLWCGKCRVMMDRDVVAAINLSRRGRLRFDRSRARYGLQGGAVEAVKGNPTPTVILRVDALKSSNLTNEQTEDLTESKMK